MWRDVREGGDTNVNRVQYGPGGSNQRDVSHCGNVEAHEDRNSLTATVFETLLVTLNVRRLKMQFTVSKVRFAESQHSLGPLNCVWMCEAQQDGRRQRQARL